jgi:hypothetical protein
MQENSRRSVVVGIRRFFAIFFLFSTIQGVISDYEKGVPLSEIIPGAVLMVIIVFFLVKPSKKKNKTLEVENLDSEKFDEPITIDENFDNMNTFDVEEQFEDIEDFLDNQPTEDTNKNYKQKKVRRNNPINDKQSMLSRIFQGKTERY